MDVSTIHVTAKLDKDTSLDLWVVFVPKEWEQLTSPLTMKCPLGALLSLSRSRLEVRKKRKDWLGQQLLRLCAAHQAWRPHGWGTVVLDNERHRGTFGSMFGLMKMAIVRLLRRRRALFTWDLWPDSFKRKSMLAIRSDVSAPKWRIFSPLSILISVAGEGTDNF